MAQDRKSVSAEINYGIRFETEEDAKKFLAQLSEEVNHYVVNRLFDKLRAIAYRVISTDKETNLNELKLRTCFNSSRLSVYSFFATSKMRVN